MLSKQMLLLMLITICDSSAQTAAAALYHSLSRLIKYILQP